MRDKTATLEKKKILTELTAKFCDAHLDEDYKQLCRFFQAG